MSNSENMTMAERLAQKLKTSPMGELLDEDDLARVCKDAIQRAFFEKRTVKDGYHERTLEPAIVEMARDLFKDAMMPVVEAGVKEMAESDEFRRAIMEVAIAAIPDLMMNLGRRAVSEAALAGANLAVERVQEGLRNGLLQQGAIHPIPTHEEVFR